MERTGDTRTGPLEREIDELRRRQAGLLRWQRQRRVEADKEHRQIEARLERELARTDDLLDRTSDQLHALEEQRHAHQAARASR